MLQHTLLLFPFLCKVLSDKECTEFYESFDEVPSSYHTIIRPQMFPPTKKDASTYSLDKCLRILPHFQNTGGFFVAVLTKNNTLPWQRKPIQEMKSSDSHNNANASNVEEERITWGPQRKKSRIYGFKEDPFVFFTEEEAVWKDIKAFFSIDDTKLKAFNATQLLTRTLTGKKKNIYFCSKAVKVCFSKTTKACLTFFRL